MTIREWARRAAACLIVLAVAAGAAAADKVLVGKKVTDSATGENVVRHRCLTSEFHLSVNDPINGLVDRADRWSLPSSTMAPNDTTIRCLVLRFNFQQDDDPNTTGNGLMNVARPLATPQDSAAYYDSVGHWVDPPPHDSAYFHAHLRALDLYWSSVSHGALNLEWDIFPYGDTSTYQLPGEMSEYGICSNLGGDIIAGLEKYFIDCITLADTAHLINPSKYPDIDFSQYGAIFLFHAGSDRQNDIGFPTTCSDLFTGFIKIDPNLAVTVDDGAQVVGEALMMPETASQDNRATALNAVLAHEFGHQIGLVDLYDTRNFLSQLGDFALMDNNGFGTGVDFGYATGQVFGVIPLMPMAWSRAFLGFDPVTDYRAGTDVRLVAAAAQSDSAKIARIPISESEYYLVEVRLDDFAPNPPPTFEQPVRLDSASNVFLGPVEVTDTGLAFTGEYDALVAGNGLAIWHVDESVAGLPAVGSTNNPQFPTDVQTRFDANQLQWIYDQRFITLVEADGLVDFGGFYRRGYGSDADLFREDRNNSFTPNTNPPAFDNTGNNTHVYVTDIRRDSAGVPASLVLDSVFVFSVETDMLSSGFPVRCQFPSLGISPIVDDIDRDGTSEVIVVSADAVFVFTTEGENFIHRESGCDPCVNYYNTVTASINSGVQYPVPLYALLSDSIFCGPVTGDFGDETADKLVAVGTPTSGTTGRVYLYEPTDLGNNGQADLAGIMNTGLGAPIALIFGDRLWTLTNTGAIYRKDSLTVEGVVVQNSFPTPRLYHGICKVGESMLLMYGDSTSTGLKIFTPNGPATDSTATYDLGAYYEFGPITVDIDRDGTPEIAVCSHDGMIMLISVDTSGATPSFSVLDTRETDYTFGVNPVAADINDDRYPELLIGGTGTMYAFNRNLTLVTEYPLEINDRYPDDRVFAPPVVSDIEEGGMPESVFPTEIGNIYSFGESETYGFPVSGGELGIGSPVVFSDSSGGYLGYLGADGWFYAWDVNADTARNFWPMYGADPSGSLALDESKLAGVATPGSEFDGDRFYNYPNPVLSGQTTFRYYLGQAPDNVTLTVYDLTGEEIASLDGPRQAGVDNEIDWNCENVTPGVYRCIIRIDYGGDEKTAFTDVAVIR
ncbi:hypothetical protein KQH82_01425 [bacterium]|nr:hypothetical protein [bacterium]